MDSCFDAAGHPNGHGVETLVHEMAHVWQYQNRGPGYLADALKAQASDGLSSDHDGAHLRTSHGSGDAYDWYKGAVEGKSFDELNPEQQAELAMYISKYVRTDGSVEVDELIKQLKLEVSTRGGKWSTLIEAHAVTLIRDAIVVLKNGRT